MAKRIIQLSLLCILFFHPLLAQNKTRPTIKSVKSLSIRLFSKKQASHFVFKIKPSSINYFEISSSGNKVKIVGNVPTSVAAGLNHFLIHEMYTSVGWNDFRPNTPESIPLPMVRVRKESPYQIVSYFTDDHFASITAHWDWDRWEKEIDLMALHGVTHPFAIKMLDDLPLSLSQKVVQRLSEYGMKLLTTESITDTVHTICLMPESIVTNPVIFDLRSDMVWHKETPDINEWIKQYPQYRYGCSTPSSQAAWDGFYHTVYNPNHPMLPPSELTFYDHPLLDTTHVSLWLNAIKPFDHDLFAASCETFFLDSDFFQFNSNYKYDAVNIVRQYITNLKNQSYHHLLEACNQEDLQIINRETKNCHQIETDLHSLQCNDSVEHAKALFQKYRNNELKPSTVMVELPISYQNGFGPFKPCYHSLLLYTRDDARSRSRVYAANIPDTWKEIQRGEIETNQTKTAFALGRDSSGKRQMVIDANNNRDFSDDPLFTPLELSFNALEKGHISSNQIIPFIFERWDGNQTILDTIPFCIGTIPGQEILMGSFARHATTHLGEIEIAICSGNFSDFSFQQTELMIINDDCELISRDQYIMYQDTLYRNMGVDLTKNVLLLEKTIASQSQLYSPQIGFKAIPFSGENYMTKDTVSIDDAIGKYIVLYFWGTWNNSCVEDLPCLNAMYNKYDHSKVVMAGILDHSPVVSLERMIQRFHINWPQILSNETNGIIQDYKIATFPTILLIAPNGKIIAKLSNVADLEKIMDQLALNI